MINKNSYAYKEGWRAFENDCSQKDNPHSPLNNEFKEWQQGFRDSRDFHQMNDGE